VSAQLTSTRCLFTPHICMVLFFTHIPLVVNHTINATPPERLQQHASLPFYNELHRSHVLCVKAELRTSTILLRSEIPSGIYAQSCALWQQATIEFTCHDHSIIACLRRIYVWCCSSRTSRSW